MRYKKKEAVQLATDAVEKFQAGDKEGLFKALDRLTCSKSGFDVIRAFGEKLGKEALKDPETYFQLFDEIMHRPREKSYDPRNLSDFIRNNEKNISALVYGGRVAVIGTAFTQMREKHWKRILKIIEAWNIEFADWYVVDSWCHQPMAHIIAEHQEEMLDRLRKWSKSDNFWFRKAVPVYLHAFFTGYSGYDISPCLVILDSLMLDSNNWVAKGMGWCLREMAKNYQGELVEFLRKWSGVKGVKKLIFKEAVKKLDSLAKEEVSTRLETK